jgi:hypothetical protein
MSGSLRALTLLAAALAAAACTADAPTVTPDDASFAAGHAAAHGKAGSTPANFNQQLAALRQATAHFQRFEVAEQAGYNQITPCWEQRNAGAMGYHYGKEFPWDLEVKLLEPELLMYEPGPNGQMRLVGMEYVVPKAEWDKAHPNTPPTLLGQEFHPHSSLPIYKLHVWLWRDNPRGMFMDWNPKVSCDHAAETDYFD